MRTRLVFVLIWLATLPVWAKPLCLEFEMRRDRWVDGQPAEGAPQKVSVVLADDYLEFTDNDGRVVHDFVSSQSHLVRGDDYVRRSLYSDIGFRVAELRNRLALIESLKSSAAQPAQQASQALGEIVEVEHLFGIDDEVSEANIVKSEGSTISYTYEGRPLVQLSAQGRPLDPAQARAFVRFLRYYCGGHPDILADLRGRGLLPDDLTIEVSNINEKTAYRFHLVSVQECDPARPDFSALRPTVLPPEPMGTLVALALQLSPQGLESARTAVENRAQKALSEGQALEAALRCFESYLIEGEQPPRMLVDSRAAFEANPDSRALFDALTVGGQDPARAAQILAGLKGKAGEAGHVLKIFQAGFLLPLGKRVEARNLYVEALMANPTIAGAWKDLGDIYHSNYETDMAWLCWDTGRKLAPGHQMLQDITRLEQVLRSNNPGFF